MTVTKVVIPREKETRKNEVDDMDSQTYEEIADDTKECQRIHGYN